MHIYNDRTADTTPFDTLVVGFRIRMRKTISHFTDLIFIDDH